MRAQRACMRYDRTFVGISAGAAHNHYRHLYARTHTGKNISVKVFSIEWVNFWNKKLPYITLSHILCDRQRE